MHSLLKTTIEEPLPVTHMPNMVEHIGPGLGNDCRRRLHLMHRQSFDWEQGGLLSPVKFIDRDSVEYALQRASEHDKQEKEMARLTLDSAMALLDPVWGGIYQYSTQGRWDRPHYRKTMSSQAGHLRIYALAYALLKFDRYLSVTQSIRTYIERFLLSDSGTFYCGQAEGVPGIDSRLFFSFNRNERELFGMPELDKRITTRENGWAIEALATNYEYTGDERSLQMALTACSEIEKNCALDDGAWLPNALANQATSLADSLAMARAMLQLFRVTFEQKYLECACASADFIEKCFRHQQCGYRSTPLWQGSQSRRQLDENISLARFTNLLCHYCKNDRYRGMAQHAFRYLAINEIATSRMEEAGILLLDLELKKKPLTFDIKTVNRNMNNPFISSAHRYFGWYKLVQYQQAGIDSVTVKIDGIQSRPLSSIERLHDLLPL